MNRFLILLLFLFLYSAQTLNLEFSLAPGLSAKNAILYVIFAVLAVQIAVRQQQRLELVSVLGPFALYAVYAVCMWLAVLLVLQYPGYRAFASLVTLKNGPIEHLMILLVFFYALNGISEPVRVLRYLLWIVIAGNVITLVDTLGIVNLGLIHLREDGRAGGPFGAANQYAAFMALCLPLMVALYWMETGFRRALATAGIIVSLLATLLAVSRAGILGLVLGALLAVVFLRKIIPMQLVARGGLMALVLGVISFVSLYVTGYAELMVDRFAQAEGDPAYASSGRTVIWPLLLGTMFQHPASLITGFGWWAYQTDLAMGLYRFSPHNTYLNVLYDLGLIGLTLYMAVLVNILRTARSALHVADSDTAPYLIGFVVGFLGLMVAIFFGELYTPWLFIWAITGICLRIAVSSLSAERERIEDRDAGRQPAIRSYATARVPVARSG